MDINQQQQEIEKLKIAFKDKLTTILTGIEMLDAVILENQTHDFNQALLTEIEDIGLKKKDLEVFSKEKFTYIVSRMDEKNKIRAQIGDFAETDHPISV